MATSSVCHLRFMTDIVSLVPPPTTISFEMTRLNVKVVLAILVELLMLELELALVLISAIEGKSSVFGCDTDDKDDDKCGDTCFRLLFLLLLLLSICFYNCS